MGKRLLVQLQLSNYANGKFVLECDSGYQMAMGRVREMLKHNPDLHVDIMGPVIDDMDGPDSNFIQTVTRPENINPDIFSTGRVTYRQHWIKPNALATRYDFDFDGIAWALELEKHKTNPELKYDAIYLNDPMHVRNFRALFHIIAGYQPYFVTHSHFIDTPSCSLFAKNPFDPTHAEKMTSLWHGQVEGAMKSDFNFWQCESSMDIFFEEMAKQYSLKLVNEVREKSRPWDDGYSVSEMNAPIDYASLRFKLPEDKIIIFVPNRVGDGKRSSDYTNCGKFLFDIANKMYANSKDFVIVAGNPSQTAS